MGKLLHGILKEEMAISVIAMLTAQIVNKLLLIIG